MFPGGAIGEIRDRDRSLFYGGNERPLSVFPLDDFQLRDTPVLSPYELGRTAQNRH
jgi:hypothetical protein